MSRIRQSRPIFVSNNSLGQSVTSAYIRRLVPFPVFGRDDLLFLFQRVI
jgi:hypothetical protein